MKIYWYIVILKHPAVFTKIFQLSFTFYELCNAQTCEGVCIGSKCMCESNKNGTNCDQLMISPTIDEAIVRIAATTTANEGLPYFVQLATISVSFNCNVIVLRAVEDF